MEKALNIIKCLLIVEVEISENQVTPYHAHSSNLVMNATSEVMVSLRYHFSGLTKGCI